MSEEKLFVVRITGKAALHLHSTARWAKFFAILGFISAAFIVIAALFMMTMGTIIPFLPPSEGSAPALSMGIMLIAAIVYLLLALLSVVLSLKLYLFGIKTILALKNNDDMTMEDAFKNLKSFYKIAGILIIVIISIYVVIFTTAITAKIMG
jgi:small-conductance mechanosensitive channel